MQFPDAFVAAVRTAATNGDVEVVALARMLAIPLLACPVMQRASLRRRASIGLQRCRKRGGYGRRARCTQWGHPR